MSIAPNRTLEKLRAGHSAIGFGVHHMRGPAAGALAAAAGFDWLFVDMEHGAMSVDQAQRHLSGRPRSGCHPHRALLRGCAV